MKKKKLSLQEFLELFTGDHFFAAYGEGLKGLPNKRATSKELLRLKDLKPLNKEDYCIFFTVNQLKERATRRLKENIIHPRAIWVDDDKPRESPRKFPLKPTTTNRTSQHGKKFKHQYFWIIENPEEVDSDEWVSVQSGMIKHGNDLPVKDLPRVLRLPGFYNNKKEYEIRHKVTAELTGKKYKWEVILKAFPPLPKSKIAKYENKKLVQMADNIISGDGHHYEMRSLIQQLAYQKCNRKLIEALASIMMYASPRKDPEHPTHGNWNKEIECLDQNITRAINNASSRQHKFVKGIPELNSYSFMKEIEIPRDYLPKEILEIIDDFKDNAKISNSMSLVNIIEALSISFRHNHIIVEKSSLKYRQTLSACLISISGGRKSFAYKQLFEKIISNIVAKLERDFAEGLKEHLKMKALSEKQIKKIERNISENASEKDRREAADEIELIRKSIPKRPPSAGLSCTDATSSSLIPELIEHGGRYSVTSPDSRKALNIFMGEHSRAGEDVTSALSIISGESIKPSRNGKVPGIDHPSGILFFNVQDDKALQFYSSPAAGDSGLTARVPPVFVETDPTDIAEEYNDPDINKKLVSSLAVIAFKIHNSKKGKIYLSNEAKKVRAEFTKYIRNRAKVDRAFKQKFPLFNKIVSQSVQAASIFSCLRVGGMSYEINKRDMECGVAYAKFIMESGLSFYLNFDPYSKYQNAQELIYWLSDKTHPTRGKYFNESFRKGDLRNVLAGKMKEKFEESFSVLVENGLAMQEIKFIKKNGEEVKGQEYELMWERE